MVWLEERGHYAPTTTTTTLPPLSDLDYILQPLSASVSFFPGRQAGRQRGVEEVEGSSFLPLRAHHGKSMPYGERAGPRPCLKMITRFLLCFRPSSSSSSQLLATLCSRWCSMRR